MCDFLSDFLQLQHRWILSATLHLKKKKKTEPHGRRKINLIYNGIYVSRKQLLRCEMTISGGKNHTFLYVDNIPFKS